MVNAFPEHARQASRLNFASHYLDLDGLRYHYLDEGQGPPVVMLHGNPTWCYFYRHLVAGLRDRYRCLVPDHIGCGLSDKPGDDRYQYTLARRVSDLERWLDHLGLAPLAPCRSAGDSPAHSGASETPALPRENRVGGEGLTLVLHDWGGMIGMAWAHRHPERVRRLVILNTAAFRLPPGKRLPCPLWLVRNTPLGPLLIRGLNLFCRAALWWCTVRRLSDEERQAYLAPYNSWTNRIAILRFVQDIPQQPGDACYELVRAVEDGLPRFQQTPMLICWGEHDFVFDLDFLRCWQERFPQAEVQRFPNAGHYILEDAHEQIVSVVRAFLARTEAQP